ncbi:cysteine hydrolase family protein [Actinomadura luteofluorescens]|uniref:Nicotinamidase-related amidase n=1 Tax=Actinomadura luteofluorescens TaxID=46163 RepID=A0A7Y9EBX2_9ACTN|nr:cysteine hydrolase [Actinomadura luteofluorescens]NYD44641.1 nicotinamidase-related amidase [Actinomadura luteofluorescens]
MIEIHGRRVPTTLEEIVDPAVTCLVVIDMQNDLCSPRGVFARNGSDVGAYEKITPALAALIASARAAGTLVVFVKITTRPDHAMQSPAQLYFEWRIQSGYPGWEGPGFQYCVEGTWGNEVLPELDCRPEDLVVEKYRSSAFAGTALDLLLRSNGITTVVATGCTTEGCLDSTVRDAGFLDYFTVVPRDCVASDRADLHAAAMTILEAYRADVVDSADLRAVWDGRSPA